MPQLKDTSPDSANDRMVKIWERVDSVLSERRTRQTLSSGLLKTRDDIEFLENKIASLTRTLQRETPELAMLKERSERAGLTFSRLARQRESEEGRYFQTIRDEQNFNHKKSLLPKIQSEIVSRGEEIEKLKEEGRAEEIRFQETAARKNRFQTDIKALTQKIEELTFELPLIKNVQSIITGLMPADMDDETCEILHCDFEKNLNEYLDDMDTGIRQVQQRISDIAREIEEGKILQKARLAEKESLEHTYQSALANAGGQTDKPRVIAAHDGLITRKAAIITDTERLTSEIDSIRSETAGLDAKLEQEQAARSRLMQRLTYLSSVKREMDSIGDINAQIRSQNEMKAKAAIEADVLNRKIDFVVSANQELAAAADNLQRMFDELNKYWTIFAAPFSGMLA